MKKIDGRIKVGTRVLLDINNKEWDIVTEINPTRVNFKCETWKGSFQDGHVIKFSNKAMSKALNCSNKKNEEKKMEIIKANLRKVLTPTNEWEIEEEKCVVENPTPATCSSCSSCKKGSVVLGKGRDAEEFETRYCTLNQIPLITTERFVVCGGCGDEKDTLDEEIRYSCSCKRPHFNEDEHYGDNYDTE